MTSPVRDQSPPKPAHVADDLATEIERLRARVAELEKPYKCHVCTGCWSPNIETRQVRCNNRLRCDEVAVQVTRAVHAARATAIPRATLAKSLRERRNVFHESFKEHGGCCAGSIAGDYGFLAEAIESGTFPPKPQEGT
jgi:hypothetical protein